MPKEKGEHTDKFLARVTIVRDWLLEKPELIRMDREGLFKSYIAKHFKISERMAIDYLNEARKDYLEVINTDYNYKKARAITDRESIKLRARKVGNFSAELNACKDRDLIEGLYGKQPEGEKLNLEENLLGLIDGDVHAEGLLEQLYKYLISKSNVPEPS